MRCLTAIFSAWLLGLQLLHAHAPFDSSVRVILQDDSVAVYAICGSTLTDNLLSAGQVAGRPREMGPPLVLPLPLAASFFELTAEGRGLAPRAADVSGDGLEFRFHFEYTLTNARSLRVEPRFLAALPAPHTCALVFGDENGNILGTAILAPGKPAPEFPLPAHFHPATATTVTAPPVRPTFAEFFQLGIGHILTGYDHLLFLAVLLLGCQRFKPMLLVITGFTLAHSLTLALSVLGFVHLSPRLVEPAVAASIVLVALQNFRRQESPSHRYALTCAFGLLHGLAFATTLRERGLAGSATEVARPLLAFNLGVETGQLLVAAILLPILFALNRQPTVARCLIRVISTGVILLAGFWFFQRIANSGE